MEQDLISIIIPAYNIAPYIERCVASVLAQTYKNLEIIVVDDGSKDDTGKIIDQIAQNETQIHVLHQLNSGVTKARMAGVEAATGEWIGFVDGDDIIEPDMYERLLNNAHEYNAEISHCGYQMVFPRRIDYYYNTGRKVRQDRQSGLKDLIEGSFVEPGVCNKLFHRTLFRSLLQNDRIDYSIRNMEDLLMNFYLFQQAECSIYEDFCPYHYMVRKGSAATTAVNENKLRDPLRVIQTIREQVSEDPMLLHAVNKRLAGCLISLSTRELGQQAELIKPYRSQGRKELKKLLPEIMQGHYRKEMKIMSIWAAYTPSTYSLVHKIYSRVKGTDRKYEVS